ncbi:hypothetical protein [Erwinia mallotivora]|uniref:hypothetical protein n=2 Tax=Erwinia mallotivora TaxID=69222 RepID=UPI0021BF86EA|nr:hypothetical protein [Erwinia mallotivora]
MMILLPWLSISGIGVLLCCIVSVGWWCCRQRGMLHQLQNYNQLLSEQNQAMTRKLSELAEQLSLLSAAFRELNRQQAQPENRGYSGGQSEKYSGNK